MKPERIFRCAYCGMPRYTLARQCHTCRILNNRHYLGKESDRATGERNGPNAAG